MNALVGARKDVAVASKTPGRTRRLNAFEVTDARGAACTLVDLPGYGFARLSDDEQAAIRAGQESEIPNFKGSDLGRFPLVSADFWTSDHLSERSRSVGPVSETRARGTLTLKRR